MNVDHLRDLTARGHEIGCHTAPHKRLPTETQRIIEEEILSAIPTANTISGSSRSSNGQRFLGARSVHDGLNDEGVDPFVLKCKAVTVRTTIREVRKWIEAARHRQAWLVLMFHQIDHEGRGPSCTPEMLGAIARHLVDSRIPAVTVRDGLKRLVK